MRETRVNPISVRSKRRITEALLELMEKTPFSKISIKDIVEVAGLTRQTFYHNFETKEEVLLSCLDDHFNRYLQYLLNRNIDNWEDVICCFFRYWQEHADFIFLLMKNDLVFLLSSKMPNYFENLRKLYFSQTEVDEQEAWLWYAFVSGALTSTLVAWLKAPGGLSARALTQMVLSMLDGTAFAKSHSEQDPNVAQIISQLQQI